MAYLYNLPNNSTSIDRILIDTFAEATFLSPLLLLFTFFVVFLGGIARQKISTTGGADYAMWSVVASLSTLMIALIMSMSVGFIRLDWLVITVVITIFSGVWLFLDRRQGEL